MEEKIHSGKFTLIENEQEIEYTTLFTFYNDRTKKNYVVYTDNTEDEEGNKQIFASSYNSDDSSAELQAVTTDEEWSNIYILLSKLVSDNNK